MKTKFQILLLALWVSSIGLAANLTDPQCHEILAFWASERGVAMGETAAPVFTPSGFEVVRQGRLVGHEAIDGFFKAVAEEVTPETPSWSQRLRNSRLIKQIHEDWPHHVTGAAVTTLAYQTAAFFCAQPRTAEGIVKACFEFFPLYAVLLAIIETRAIVSTLTEATKELPSPPASPRHWIRQWGDFLLEGAHQQKTLVWEGEIGGVSQRLELRGVLSKQKVPTLEIVLLKKADLLSAGSTGVVAWKSESRGGNTKKKEKTRGAPAESSPTSTRQESDELELDSLGLTFEDTNLGEYWERTKNLAPGSAVFYQIANELGMRWPASASGVTRWLRRLNGAKNWQDFVTKYGTQQIRTYGQNSPVPGAKGLQVGGEAGQWRLVLRWTPEMVRPQIVTVFDYHGGGH